MSFDDYIFVRPSFLRGIAKAIDISGSLSRSGVAMSRTPQEADARALASDFRVVQRDIAAAFATIARDAEKPAP